jgi:allantoicase
MPGSEWAIFRLGLPGSISRIEVDTHHFKVRFFIQHTDKKERKKFLIYREIIWDRVQSHT